MKTEHNNVDNSLYSRLGWLKTSWIIWNSIPLLMRPISFPICLSFYRSYIKQSYDLEDLRMYHSDIFLNSHLFRIFRPRYHKIREHIQKELAKTTNSVAMT